MKIRTILVSLLVIGLIAGSIGMAAARHANDCDQTHEHDNDKAGSSSIVLLSTADQDNGDQDQIRDCDEETNPDGDELHSGW
ncbi:MAG TPA: hypothetical protein VMW20_01510 [Candidatus Nanoarchaeia archaeon]|nr:hypothetical protein [Candidatus Nanoarchaeia archaeon]